jgi:hypothetical protein
MSTSFQQLSETLSIDRLSSYYRSATDPELDVLERYLWNTALCEALYPVLQGFEVGFRNAIHNAASQHFGTQFWFQVNTGILRPSEQAKVTDAMNSLAARKKPVTAGRVVAELSLGFRTALLDRRYERILWPRLIRQAFPGVPRRLRTRGSLLPRVESARRLRNRVFHHEPVWHWRNLQQQHLDLLELIGWISPKLSSTLGLVDRFSTVFSNGTAPYRQLLYASLPDLH